MSGTDQETGSLAARILAQARQMPRWRLFSVLVAITAVLATFASALTYRLILVNDNRAPLHIALIAPMSGDQSVMGAAMEAGTRQAMAAIKKVVAGHPVDLVVLDEADPEAAQKARRDPLLAGVIGGYTAGAAAGMRDAAAKDAVATLSLTAPGGDAVPGFFSMTQPRVQEVRFLANYVRNVLGERLVSIVLPDDPAEAALADAFDAVMQRFGTRVVYRWTIAGGGGETDGLRAVAAEINDKKIAGSVLFLGSPDFAARGVASLRAANTPNRIVGLREMATVAFSKALEAGWGASNTSGAGLTGTVVTTPIVFDTAGSRAQEFRTAITGSGSPEPDWAAVLSYDAASMILASIAAEPNVEHADAAELRAALSKVIATFDDAEHALPALSGPLFFQRGQASSATQFAGVYDGSVLISSPIQLTPIREEGVSNYLDELSAGRALYVNDRFMYKTSVVYAGLQLEKVLDLNPDTNVADIEFLIWFRWRGSLDPQTVVFPNAVTPIVLDKPERESKSGDMAYRVYRVRGKFFMNYSKAPHAYGTELVEIDFRHRVLGVNNLRYVTDIIGLGLTETAANSGQQSLFERFLGSAPAGVLARRMAAGKVLAGTPGWLVDRAWISQESGLTTSQGDPVYTGFGRPVPTFSTIALGMVAKADALDIQNAVPANWLVYIVIFAAFGIVLAQLLDRRERGNLWRLQTLLLRWITWPALLMAGSAYILNVAQASSSAGALHGIDMTTSVVWWIVGAWLANITVERMIWVPLELTTGQRVPTVFRVLVTIIIFVLASFGIVAFVLGKTITSLLATSGMLTLIVGLAVQSNLKDIFSGIMLNLERPFAIGDYLRVNRNVGQVVDISWRTTRVEVDGGAILALPNGRLSDSEIENLSRAVDYDANMIIPLPPSYPPEKVIPAITAAMKKVAVKHRLKGVLMREIVLDQSHWVAKYGVRVVVYSYPDIRKLRSSALVLIWESLHEAGITWDQAVLVHEEEAEPALD